ncbi:MAG: hypothetical protein ACWGNO_00115 [Desulfobacterales bacterium]
MGKKRTQPHLKIKQIESMLRKTNGLISHAAELLGVSAPAIHDRINRSPHLQEVRRQIEERLIDKSENVVYHHMQNKNLTAAIFHLKTKGKSRGWVEKRESEISGNLDITQDDWVKKMEAIESGSKKKTKAKK